MRKFLIALIVVLCCIWAVKLSKLRTQPAEPATEPVPPAASAPAQAVESSTQAVAAQPEKAQAKPEAKPAAPASEKTPQAKAEQPKAEQPKAQAPQDKFQVLDEILASGNDNDPRLDTAFNNLSQPDRRKLEGKYASLKREKLNQRGTIVYLLGRDPKSASDWNFLTAVASESPCLSLSDCGKDGGPLETHREIGIELSLSYPSMMALKQAEHAVTRGDSAGRAVIEAAKASPSKLVKEEAERFARMGR